MSIFVLTNDTSSTSVNITPAAVMPATHEFPSQLTNPHLYFDEQNLNIVANYKWAHLPLPENDLTQMAIQHYIQDWEDVDLDLKEDENNEQFGRITLKSYGESVAVFEIDKNKISAIYITGDSVAQAQQHYSTVVPGINEKIYLLLHPSLQSAA